MSNKHFFIDEEEEKAEQDSPKNKPAGEQPNMLEAAEHLAERIEAANRKTEELLERQERLAAERMLGGRAEAGAAPPQKLDETPQEYAKRIMRGELNDDERAQRSRN